MTGLANFLEGSLSEELDDLLGSEFVAADGTDFVRINSQAFEAGAIILVNFYNTINLLWSINSFLKKLRQIY